MIHLVEYKYFMNPIHPEQSVFIFNVNINELLAFHCIFFYAVFYIAIRKYLRLIIIEFIFF